MVKTCGKTIQFFQIQIFSLTFYTKYKYLLFMLIHANCLPFYKNQRWDKALKIRGIRFWFALIVQLNAYAKLRLFFVFIYVVGNHKFSHLNFLKQFPNNIPKLLQSKYFPNTFDWYLRPFNKVETLVQIFFWSMFSLIYLWKIFHFIFMRNIHVEIFVVSVWWQIFKKYPNFARMPSWLR